MHSIALDRLDVRILELLMKDSRIPRLELAEAVNLSSSQCFRRLKRLEQSGIIERYSVVLNSAKAGFDVNALVMVQYSKSEPDARHKLLALIEQTPIIHECYSITGEHDFALKVSCASMTEFNHLINETFQTRCISGMHSYMLLDCFKNTLALPSAK
ncbi:Lrp/AsnC family transcriptional regulator [Vibrio fluvialis]|uniref:Lrp/AsnC family transcriptional regulator n=1 Tax=Vibrio fluvialis TaxID=676 RepID=UPI002B25F729|nr:Lrp/AsnC family transcriptional regulator [Vibrio fluvialis]WPK54998.1 Lrp/AsnC family transcriptional regulator [Vibrio fluvialis]